MGETRAFRMDLDTSDPSTRYYRNAVKNHWDPAAVTLDTDRPRLADLPSGAFEHFRATVAKFGAGERAVTEDLAPLSVVVESAADQVFLATQLYDEARHLEFFRRYWDECIRPVERDRGLEPTAPTSDRWFDDAYDGLLARTDAAMYELLDADTPENRARALCHYHLTVEGILAQTAYWGLHRTYGTGHSALPYLPGFVAGLERIRRDEGRHVGFGMRKLSDLVTAGVDPQLLHDTVGDLLPLVQRTAASGLPAGGSPDHAGPSATDIEQYAAKTHLERMNQITNAAGSIPDVESLVTLE